MRKRGSPGVTTYRVKGHIEFPDTVEDGVVVPGPRFAPGDTITSEDFEAAGQTGEDVKTLLDHDDLEEATDDDED